MDRIITISREFGSGGRELGRRLSEQLNIAYYDQEIYQRNRKTNQTCRAIRRTNNRAKNHYLISNSHREKFLSVGKSSA